MTDWMLACSRCGATYPASNYHVCPTYTPPIYPTTVPSPQVSTVQMGWQCPVCGQVYAPWVYSCQQSHTRPATGANDASE